MKKIKLLGFFLCISLSCFALNIRIIESTSYNSGHVMDGVWSSVATSMGHTPTISPQTTLDNNAFFPTTDILIISSGVINIPANRVATILAFLQTGKPVYIETEYLSTYDANITFASLISSLGGTFTWNGTVAGTLAPMNVLGTFATANNSVPNISYFWYGDSGTGDCNTIPFLQYNGQYFGWQYVPTNPAWGNIISTCDQDWVNTSTSLPLMQNIITHLINPGFIPSASGSVHLGNDTTLCNGNQLVLNATTPNSTYLWQNGSTGPTFTVTTAGTYFVTVSGSCGNSHDTIVVTYNSLSTSILSQTNVSCNGGVNGTATVNASGSGPFSYAWAPIGGNGVTASNLPAGTYTVTVTSASTCSGTQTVTITQPTALSVSSTSTMESCGNSNGSATVTPSGGAGGYLYTWAPSGGSSSGATNLSAGTYTCTITDANSCVITQSFIITNSNALSLSVQSQNNVTCNGAADGNATISSAGGTAPFTYAWSPSGGSNATASNLGPGTYTVTVTDAASCFSTQTVTITEPAAVTLNASSTAASCGNNNGSAAVIAAGGAGGFTYTWSPSGGSSANAPLLVGGVYTVTVTDANSCVSTATVNIATSPALTSSLSAQQNVTCAGGSNGSAGILANGGTSPFNYSWAPSGGSSATASNLIAGIYTVTTTDAAGCISVLNLTITQPPALVLTTSGNVSVCLGDSTLLNSGATGGTGAYNFTWNPGAIAANSVMITPNVTSTYTSTVTDANGCIITSPVIVTVTQPVTLTAAGSTQVCAGQSAILTANSNNGGPYTWMPGNVIGNSITVTPGTTTTYTVSVDDYCTGTLLEDSVIVAVETVSPQFTFAPASGCVPLIVQFNDQSSTSFGAISNWHWDFGDGNTSTLHNPIDTFTTAGTFTATLTVTTNDGCTVTYASPLAVTVFPLPVAAFTITNLPLTVLEPDAGFIDNSTSAVAWQWNFGDGGTSTLQNPTHAYPSDTASYIIMLIVSSANGCMDTTYGSLRVEDDFTFFIPNAFTPNGNGTNESFGGIGSGIQNYHMMIFDRWGMLLYESNDINKQWDGTYKGVKAMEDVYVYKISVTDMYFAAHSYIGRVTLVR